MCKVPWRPGLGSFAKEEHLFVKCNQYLGDSSLATLYKEASKTIWGGHKSGEPFFRLICQIRWIYFFKTYLANQANPFFETNLMVLNCSLETPQQWSRRLDSKPDTLFQSQSKNKCQYVILVRYTNWGLKSWLCFVWIMAYPCYGPNEVWLAA